MRQRCIPAALLAVVLLLGTVAGARDTADVARPAHHKPGGGFTNLHQERDQGGFFNFIRKRLFGDDEWASYDPARDGDVPSVAPGAACNVTGANVTWLGHSTMLICHRGIHVLTDPMLTARASPINFAGPKRISAPALTIDELPRIDVVVISHDHYDHLDRGTIRALGNAPMYYVPLGVKAWFEGQGISADRVVELDWWQQREHSVGEVALQLVATPSQHFSGRGLTNRDGTLWVSWHLAWSDFRVWFGGDTGYNDVQFREIGARFGNYDLGIVPIGAYLPRDFMRVVHVDPAEAVAIHTDIGARRSVGVHWGAFLLSAEHPLEPPRALSRALVEAGLSAEEFATWAIGETRVWPTGGGDRAPAVYPQ